MRGAEFDFAEVKRLVESKEWEADDEDGEGRELRMFCLGSWLSLSPSGKVYMPFACSNVAGCDGCNGTGIVRYRQSLRVVKRAQARSRRKRKLWFNRYFSASRGKWPARILAQSKHLNKYMKRFSDTCLVCGGSGSAEAHADEVWREYVENGLEEVGLFLYEVDEMLYAAEYREIDEPEDAEES